MDTARGVQENSTDKFAGATVRPGTVQLPQASAASSRDITHGKRRQMFALMYTLLCTIYSIAWRGDSIPASRKLEGVAWPNARALQVKPITRRRGSNAFSSHRCARLFAFVTMIQTSVSSAVARDSNGAHVKTQTTQQPAITYRQDYLCLCVSTSGACVDGHGATAAFIAA